jgi:5-methyltetrahydropteroyltriglutamate--homocysteine methyltransferase
MSTLLGVVPERYLSNTNPINLTTYFQMARGDSSGNQDVQACEMTKWFDTNYHYIVPELRANQDFVLSHSKLFDEIKEAHSHGYKVKPIILGPLSYLWLSKTYPNHFDKLTLLPRLITAYQEIFSKLQALHIEWVQIDEPILVLDLPFDWKNAFDTTYQSLQDTSIKLLLTTYFGGLEDNIDLTCGLPVSGIHIDAVRAPQQIPQILSKLRSDCILSLGVINGRNIWKTDLHKMLQLLRPLQKELGSRLWISSSCSFLHSPVDLDTEKLLKPEIKQWLAFAKQKTQEIVTLAKSLQQSDNAIDLMLSENKRIMDSKSSSPLVHNAQVQKRCDSINQLPLERSPYFVRHALQHARLKLPLLPTTTIGSFPQTAEIRSLRRNLKNGTLTLADYESKIRQQIQTVIEKQEQMGLDVLVHGEPERNDMVEYFGEQLDGFAFTQNGWIQSYGSRCVKPPIIYGDVSRPRAMTVQWSSYAQSLTKKPVKGMLTGPMTMLMWSFVRDDLSPHKTAQQIALVLRDEVKDLESAGIQIIQIDEPAFREGLPLRTQLWNDYLKKAVECFKLVSNGVEDTTQIHTHMCYSEFNDIIEAIADLDADVLSIETSRSHMELLEAFKAFSYPNEIGPGVYDIHSPRTPSVDEIIQLMEKAAALIPPERLWVNPDCGLKTRTWPEVEVALSNMVKATQQLRIQFQKNR